MTKLCPRGKAAAKRKFKVYPSAYANAYASKICAGKIKDPSGVKRKDFRGPKPAAKGAMMTAAGGQRKGVKGKSAKELQMDRNYKIKNRRKPNTNIPIGMGIAAPVPAEKRKKITEFRKAGGMTAGSRSALGRIQKANMVKAKRGKFSDQGKSFTKRRLALAGSLPPMGKSARGMGKIADPKSFIKRRMMLAGPKSVLPSQSDVASKVKRVGKKLLPKRVKTIVSLLGAVAAGAAGQKALDKKKKKKVDKKKMGGLKAELNNPAKGYMAGGMADYYKDLM